MAGNWRDDDRYGQRGDNRNRWSNDDRQRNRNWDDRDNGSRDHWDDYAFGRNERRGEYGWRGGEAGYGEGYGSSRGPGGGSQYPRYGRGTGLGYGGQDDNWGNGWRREGQAAPTNWGPDWGDAHGRMGRQAYGGSYGVGYGGSSDGYGDYGYGRDVGNRPTRGNQRDFWDRASDEVASWFGDDEASRRRQMDEREDHRGRGPKGYTRSDDRIREDVSDALSDDPSVDASDISVSVSGSEVTLTGTVSTRMAKRRAEDCADRVSGVKHVQNNLRVKETTYGSGAGGLSTSTTATGAKQNV